MGFIYYLRPELRPRECIVDRCAMQPIRWGCLCACHHMRWYQHGSFELLGSQARARREEHLTRIA